jgi:hypothetical protein
MAFNRDINSLFDRYVNNILQEVARPVEVSGTFESEAEKDPKWVAAKTAWEKKTGKSFNSLPTNQKISISQNFLKPAAESGFLVNPATNERTPINQNQAASPTTAELQNRTQELQQASSAPASTQTGTAPAAVATSAQTTPSPTANQTSAQAAPATSSPTTTSQSTETPTPFMRDMKNLKNFLFPSEKPAMNRAQAATAARKGQTQAATAAPTATATTTAPAPNQASAPATPSTSTNQSNRDEKTVQADLDAAIKSGDQAKASQLFDELGAVRKQTNSPNQPIDLLKKYPVAGDASSSEPGAPVQQEVKGTADKAGVYTPQQLAEFQRQHGTSFDPNSKMDRSKMMNIQGGTKGALPGAGNKPGQLKTPSTATTPGGQFNPNAEVRRGTPANLPPGYVERQNSKLPGVLGTASNVLGRIGDTAKNVAMGTAGKVNPKPTYPPQAAPTQTTTSKAPRPKSVNPKIR